MTDESNGRAPVAEEPVSDPQVQEEVLIGEIVTIPQCAAKVTLREDGSGALTFTLPGRIKAYQFLLDREGRERIGRMLLGPSVQTFGPQDIPHGR